MIISEQLAINSIPGYRVVIIKQATTIIHFARCDLVHEAEKVDFDYLFWIDSDMGFSQQVLKTPGPNGFPIIINYMKKMLDLNLNIVGAPYVTRKPPHRPNVFYPPAPGGNYIPMYDLPESGVHEVGAIATGFLCIKRNVFRVLESKMKERQAKWNQAKDSVEYLKKNMIDNSSRENKHHLATIEEAINNGNSGAYPPFWVDYVYNKYLDEYKHMGEDVYFCREATRAGFKIYCDCDIEIGHESIHFATPSFYRHYFQDEMIKDHLEACANINMPTPVKPVQRPESEPVCNINKIQKRVEARIADG